MKKFWNWYLAYWPAIVCIGAIAEIVILWGIMVFAPESWRGNPMQPGNKPIDIALAAVAFPFFLFIVAPGCVTGALGVRMACFFDD